MADPRIRKNIDDLTDEELSNYAHALERLFAISAANPDSIDLAFSGVDPVRLDARGNLVLHTPSGDLTQQAPVLYQDGPAGRQSDASEPPAASCIWRWVSSRRICAPVARWRRRWPTSPATCLTRSGTRWRAPRRRLRWERLRRLHWRHWVGRTRSCWGRRWPSSRGPVGTWRRCWT